jgi:hypothetical protein
MTVPDLLGMVGVFCLLAAYALLQTGRLHRDDWPFSALNAAGSGLILFSLIYDFNLASTVVEGAWFAISLWGLSRVVFKGR